MNLYLVTVDTAGTGEIIAGIYVRADNKPQAIAIVRRYLSEAKFTAYAREV